MPQITYVQQDGSKDTVEAKLGSSVMQTAVGNGVNGIVAECGGNLACATCHVYVDPAFLADLVPIAEDEEDMLDCTGSPREDNSRLSCQLKVTEALDGLVVSVPESQY